jgi:hypothetical protein
MPVVEARPPAPVLASRTRISGYSHRVAEPVVTKEYREDLGERDADGFCDYAYRYWVYWFDFDGRRYRARIYTDDQTDASVMHIGSGRPATYDDDLRAIAAYLRNEAEIRTVSTLSPAGGFEPVITFDS